MKDQEKFGFGWFCVDGLGIIWFSICWFGIGSFIHIATIQPTTKNNLKQLLLGWFYYR
jgi:hypothetical protein